MDWSERFLRLALKRMPSRRNEWGMAMLSEHAAVRGGPDRWRFTMGCAQTVLGELLTPYARRARGVVLVASIWAPVWALMFAAFLTVLEMFLGPDNEPSLAFMMWIIGQVGLVSGGIFGVLLAVAENGRPAGRLSLRRAAFLGSLSSAVFPIVTGRANQTFWTCAFGAIAAVLLVGLARRAARAAEMPNFMAACTLLPVQDLVNPERLGEDAAHR